MKLTGDEKILIIKPSSFGDVLHALPLLDCIKSEYPGVKISWVVNRDYAELLEDNPMIDKIFIFERKRWGEKRSVLKTCIEFLRFTGEIRSCGFDLVIDLQGLLRSGLITFLSGAKYTVGLSNAREGSRLFFNHVVDVSKKNLHAVDRYLSVCEKIGIVRKNPVKFSLFIKEDVRKKVDKLLIDNGIKKKDIVVVVNANSRWRTKCWNQDRFAVLSDRLMDEFSVKIVMIGAVCDSEYVKQIVGMMKNTPVVLVGKTTLLGLSSVLKRADIMITNDSGPMHMSVAVSTATIALFGPTDPKLTGPYGENGDVIFKQIDCQPCFKRNCATKECMNLIDIDDVLASFKKMLKDKLVKSDSNDNK